MTSQSEKSSWGAKRFECADLCSYSACDAHPDAEVDHFGFPEFPMDIEQDERSWTETPRKLPMLYALTTAPESVRVTEDTLIHDAIRYLTYEGQALVCLVFLLAIAFLLKHAAIDFSSTLVLLTIVLTTASCSAMSLRRMAQLNSHQKWVPKSLLNSIRNHLQHEDLNAASRKLNAARCEFSPYLRNLKVLFDEWAARPGQETPIQLLGFSMSADIEKLRIRYRMLRMYPRIILAIGAIGTVFCIITTLSEPTTSRLGYQFGLNSGIFLPHPWEITISLSIGVAGFVGYLLSAILVANSEDRELRLNFDAHDWLISEILPHLPSNSDVPMNYSTVDLEALSNDLGSKLDQSFGEFGAVIDAKIGSVTELFSQRDEHLRHTLQTQLDSFSQTIERLHSTHQRRADSMTKDYQNIPEAKRTSKRSPSTKRTD